MSKATKVFLILFVSVFTAGVAANIICVFIRTASAVLFLYKKLSTKLKPFQQNSRLLG